VKIVKSVRLGTAYRVKSFFNIAAFANVIIGSSNRGISEVALALIVKLRYAFVLSPLSQTYHILLSSITILFYNITLYEYDMVLYKKCAKYSKNAK
jgi:hypothetical protein